MRKADAADGDSATNGTALTAPSVVEADDTYRIHRPRRRRATGVCRHNRHVDWGEMCVDCGLATLVASVTRAQKARRRMRVLERRLVRLERQVTMTRMELDTATETVLQAIPS